MQNQLTLLATAFLVLFVSSCSRKKCEAYGGEPRTFQYGPEKTYSRAVAAKGNKIYVGNSDGLIYKVNIRSGKSKVISTEALPELRDIHVLGRNKVVAMQSADTSRMIYLKGKREKTFQASCTETGSSGWKTLDNKWMKPCEAGPIFLDGMDILPSGIGFMMGDPVAGVFSFFMTDDGGKSWNQYSGSPKAYEGEAGFAASGTNVQCLDDSTFIFVSGGMQTRFFKTTDQGRSWTSVPIPFQKSAGSGAFSVHFSNQNDGVSVGGDYTQPDNKEKTCFYTRDGGITWTESAIPPLGYRSCVVEFDGNLFACGTNGVDKSEDGGITWGRFMSGNYMALVAVKNRLYATTSGGKIVELVYR